MGFEILEMLRNFELLSTDSTYVLNDFKDQTVLCNMELDTYPSDESIMAALQKSGKKGYTIKATECAREIGNSLLTNVVMVGALCQLSPLFNSQEIKQVLVGKSPSKVREQNLKAFEAGGLLLQKAIKAR